MSQVAYLPVGKREQTKVQNRQAILDAAREVFGELGYEAAKEIKALISASSQQVAEGVNLVGETGKALERIVRQVSEIANVVGEIAASAKEEALGLGQVNTAVNQMDQVTQQNAAMVEETTAASRMLADQTEELFGLVSRFKLSGAAETTAGPARRTAPVYASVGNAALATAEDDWTEF